MKVQTALAIAETVTNAPTGHVEWRNLAIVGEVAFTLTKGAKTPRKLAAYEGFALAVNAAFAEANGNYVLTLIAPSF